MIVGDFLRITQFFRQGSIEGLMVSFWELSTMIGVEAETATYLAQSFHKAWYTLFGDLQHPSCNYYRTMVEVGPSLTEFGEVELTQLGEAIGEAAPSYVALQVKQQVGSRITRAGYKRIPFVSEDTIVGNTVEISGGQLANLRLFYGLVADIPEFNPVGSGSFGLTPYIIGRTNIGTPESPNYEINWAVTNQVLGASITKNTHQNSRDK